eukprot:7081201-Pyramimonas_sp.AAC.1
MMPRSAELRGGRRIRAVPPGSSEELLLGHWGLRWSSLWAHEAMYWMKYRMQAVPLEIPTGPRNAIP